MKDACVLNELAQVMVCQSQPVDLTAITVLVVGFWIVAAILGVGYILNLVKMYYGGQYDSKFGLRTIGVFIPFIGGVVGYL